MVINGESQQLSPADEAKVVRKLLSETNEDSMCSISASWWSQWVKYTGYDSPEEVADCEERPGPIEKNQSISYGLSNLPPKLIPEEVWDQLHVWYGDDSAQMTDREENEVFYLKIYLLGSGRRPFTSQFESQVTIREVFNKACRFFNLVPEKRYLYDPENRRELSTDENLELGDADLEDETKLCILSKASTMDSFTIHSVGRVGLENQGNTCYMNSALQVLLHCPEIMDYFLTDKFKEHVSKNNPEGSGGKIVEAFAELTKKLWKVGNMRSTRPSHFWNAFSQQYIQFSSKSQHDTAEFAEGVLDGLMEDCNRSTIPKIFQVMDDDASKSDKEIGDENWDYHMSRSNSYITDKFHGQYRAVTTCPSCSFSSRKFESFTVLQLGLPHPKSCDVSFVLIDVGGNSAPKKMKVVAGGKGTVQDVLLEVAESIGMKDPNPMGLLALGQKKAEGEVVMKENDDRISDFLGFGPLVVYHYPCHDLGPQSGGTETHFIHQKQSFHTNHYTWTNHQYRDRQKFGFPLVVWIPELSVLGNSKSRSPKKRPHEILEEIFEASLRPAKRQKEEVILLPPCPEAESGATVEESIEMEEITAALPALEVKDAGRYLTAGGWDQVMETTLYATTKPESQDLAPSDSMRKSPTAVEELDSEEQNGAAAVSLPQDGCEIQATCIPQTRENNENSPDWTCEAGTNKQPECGKKASLGSCPVQPHEDDRDASSDQDQLVSCRASGLEADMLCTLQVHQQSEAEKFGEDSPTNSVSNPDLKPPSPPNSDKSPLAVEPNTVIIPGPECLPCKMENSGQSQNCTNSENCACLCNDMVNSMLPAETGEPSEGCELDDPANECNGAISADSEMNARVSAADDCQNVLLLSMTPEVSCSTADAGAGDDADSVAAQGNGSGSDYDLGLSSLIADEEPVTYGCAPNNFSPHVTRAYNRKIISSCQSGSYDLMEVDDLNGYSSYSNSKSRKIIVDWTSTGENNYDLEMLQESVVDYQVSQSDQIHTILECFEHDFSPHLLDKNNLWECGQCKKRVEGVKSMRLWKTPDVLLISLKRFNFSGHRSIKLTPKVHFPLCGLDLSEFCESQDTRDSMLYDLCGVCYHHGSNPKSGHYTAVAKMPDGRWCEFNDSAVSEVTADQEIVTSSAYLLCYRRRGAETNSAEETLKQKWLADFQEQKRKAEVHFAEDSLTDCDDNSDDSRPTYSGYESSYGGYGRFAKWNSLADDYCHRPWDMATSTGLIDTTCSPLVSSPNWDHNENYSSTLSSYPGNQQDIESNGSGQLYLRPRQYEVPTQASPTNRSRETSPDIYT